MVRAVLIQTTTGSRNDAERLAEILVERRLAGCVQIGGPITSIYHWQDNLQKEEEYLVTIKTIESAVAPLSQLIQKHHPYDVPEIIVVPITDGSQDYLRWLQQQVSTE